MIEIKMFTALICSALFWWGGHSWHNARRFIMPAILSVLMLFSSHWCLWAISSLACMGVFCLGYGEKSALRHCFGNGWGRGVWGLVAALTLSLWAVCTGHLIWYIFVSYLALNFTLENALKNAPQWIGDPIIGLGFSIIALFINNHPLQYHI